MMALTRKHWTAAVYGGLVVVLLVIAGCGGGGGGGGGGPTGTSSHDPIVTDFRIQSLTPEKANTQIRYLISATVTDPDNDLVGGRAEATIGNTVSKTLEAGDFSGTTLRVVLVTNPAPPGHYNGIFAVFDAAGHRSNDSSFSLTISAEGPVSPAPGNLLDRLAPAR